MKLFILGLLALLAQSVFTAFAQLPPGHMYGRCSDIYGPNYGNSRYSASGSCKNGTPVSCATDPMDGTPDYYCTAGSGNGKDYNPSVAADEACGCMDN